MTATEPVDPTKTGPTEDRPGRLLPEGWRVERTYGYDGGTIIRAASGRCLPRAKTVAESGRQEMGWKCSTFGVEVPDGHHANVQEI